MKAVTSLDSRRPAGAESVSGWETESQTGGEVAVSALLADWDAWMVVTGKSENTRYQYRCAFLRFVANSMLSPRSATEAELMAYIARGIPGDQIRAIKTFYNYAQGRIRPDNPAREVQLPRSSTPEAPDYTDEELARFFLAAERFQRRWELEFLFATGLRVGSAVAIRPAEDIDAAEAWMNVRRTKAGRGYDKGIPLNQRALDALARLPKTGVLFGGVSEQSVRLWCRKASEIAFEGHLYMTPHSLRHAAITRWARRSGADVATVADLAGWTDGAVSQYRRYVGTNREGLRAASEAS